MISPTFFWRSLKERCANRRRLAHITIHSVCWHSTVDGRIANWMRVNTVDDPSTSDKNLAKIGPVIAEFLQVRLRRAGYTLGFATHL